MNIAAVRSAMASTLDAAIAGVQVNAYALAQPTPPGIQILPPGVQYDRTFQPGLDEWTFIVQAFVSLSADIGSQKLLDSLCAPSGAGSVKDALEADRTLGGTVQALWVTSQSPGQQVSRPEGNPMLLVEWTVQVFAN